MVARKVLNSPLYSSPANNWLSRLQKISSGGAIVLIDTHSRPLPWRWWESAAKFSALPYLQDCFSGRPFCLFLTGNLSYMTPIWNLRRIVIRRLRNKDCPVETKLWSYDSQLQRNVSRTHWIYCMPKRISKNKTWGSLVLNISFSDTPNQLCMVHMQNLVWCWTSCTVLFLLAWKC